MYDKSRFFIGGILADVFGPCFVAGSIEYFGIRYLYKTVCSFLINACLIGDEAEIVIPGSRRDGVVVLVTGFVSGGEGDENKSLTFVSGQGVHTVCIGFYHVQPVGYFDVFQHFFSFIETSVVVLIHKNTPVVGGGSRKRSCQ